MLGLLFEVDYDGNELPYAVAALSLCLLFLWRLFKFSLVPVIWAQEPKEAPYWIPGHGISFLRDSDRVFTDGRKHLGNIREPFAVTLAGEKFYVLTSPKDVGEAFRKSDTLSYDGFVEFLMRSFGVSDLGVDKMYQKFSPDGHVMYHPNPQQKCLARLTIDLHKHQLLSGGPEFESLSSKFVQYLDASLRWEVMDHAYVLEDRTPAYKTVSLLSWCMEILVKAGTSVFFGDEILRMDPQLPRSFYEFDKNAWMILYRVPKLFSRNATTPLARNIDTLTAYFRLPKDERSGATWFNQTLEAEQRQLGLTDDDIARLMILIHWGSNANTFKLCFWILAYLLNDIKLLDAIRTETDRAMRNDTVNLEHLMNHCPRLEAVFFEVLRLKSSSISMRKVIGLTEIGGKVLRPGYRVLVPFRQLNLNKDVFGEDATEFNPERFLLNKELSNSASFRPFGGGANYCPGRFIARQEVVVFIALVLYRFDIDWAQQPDHSQKGCRMKNMPKHSVSRPTLGIMGPADGEDVIIDIKQRKHDLGL